MWGKLLLAVVALHIEFGELCDKCLLHLCLVVDFFFDCDLDLDSLGVAFSPYEASVDYLGLVKSLDFFQQQGKELFTVAVTGNPWGSHVAVTESTEVDDGLLGDTDGDIGFGDGTGGADVADGGDELDSTHGAEDGHVAWALDLHGNWGKLK